MVTFLLALNCVNPFGIGPTLPACIALLLEGYTLSSTISDGKSVVLDIIIGSSSNRHGMSDSIHELVSITTFMWLSYVKYYRKRLTYFLWKLPATVCIYHQRLHHVQKVHSLTNIICTHTLNLDFTVSTWYVQNQSSMRQSFQSKLAGLGGFEPPIFCLTGSRIRPLCYRP